MQKTIVVSFLIDELERSNRCYGATFTSAHEGYTVLLEELDELWDEIKKKHPDKDQMHAEAVQVGAMAIKFTLSMNSWTSMDVCRRCVFVVMTTEDLAEVGDDPCETCNSNCSNWKGRS